MEKSTAQMWRTKVGKNGKLEWTGFPPFDVEKCIRELKPENEGRSYANKFTIEQDPEDENELTSMELELLRPVNSHIDELKDWHSRLAGEISKELSDVWDAPDSKSLLDSIVHGFEIKATRVWNDFRSTQRQLLSDHHNITMELNSFKDANGLNQRHQAKYPESWILHLALLFAFMIIEGFANMAFFPQELGLIGGFFTAILVSLANVSVCFILGWMVIRQLNHISTYRKVIGALVLVLGLIVVFGLHSSVAQFREMAARNPDAVFLNALTFDPTGLQDMESLLLIAIGWSISLFSIYKGYTFDDPYPGFGENFRAWKSIDDSVVDAERAFHDHIIEAHSITMEEIQAIPNSLESKAKQLQKLEAEIGTYLSCVNSYYAQARNGGLSLITAFRSAVQRVRQKPSSMPISEDLINNSINSLDPEEIEISIREHIETGKNSIAVAKSTYFESKQDSFKQLKEALNRWMERRVTEVGSGLKSEIVSQSKNAEKS